MSIVYTRSKNENRKGHDTDIEFYDVLDASGALIAKCDTSIHPPQRRRTELRKFAPDGITRIE
ncbi:hypothetical protein [Caballeronia terrestris]|nr:hypothetical protein [Caballeronia terrestris]